MAGPSIMVKVLGDLTGLSKATDGAAKKGQSAAGQIHGAFSTLLGQLNATGVLGPFGDSLATIDDAFEKIVGHGKDVGNAMLGVGGALAGVGLGLQALGSKDQAAHQQLQAAVAATGKSYDDYSEQVEAAIKNQEKFGDSASETQNALAALTEATNDPAKALKLLGEATDLAAAKHESLSQAATDLGKVYNGNTKLLKQFGIVVAKQPNYLKAEATATSQAQKADAALMSAKQHLADIEELDAGKKKLTTAEAIRLRDAEDKVTAATVVAKAAHQKLTAAQDAAKTSTGKQTDAVTLLGNKLAGQAAAQADTFTGKIDALKTKFEDSAAQIGQKYGPAITGLGGALSVAGTAVKTATSLFGGMKKATEDATTAEEGATAASDVLAGASGIGLVLLAIAALVAAGYVLYKNWNTIWKAIKAVAMDVFNWIKSNWPYLLGILLGPIALAAAAIYKNWATIKAGAVAVWDWLKTAWGTVEGYITAPFTAAWAAIERTWGTVEGWFSRLPGDIAHLASGMWDGIANAFVDAMNFVINVWDRLQFKTPTFQLPFPPHTKFPSITVGVPHIADLPHLAQGGLITGTGVVYAHAGEVISPAPAAKRSGPAVVVQNATFSQALDVDLFMKRAAWVAQTERI